jgi:hypothetical protein
MSVPLDNTLVLASSGSITPARTSNIINGEVLCTPIALGWYIVSK